MTTDTKQWLWVYITVTIAYVCVFALGCWVGCTNNHDYIRGNRDGWYHAHAAWIDAMEQHGIVSTEHAEAGRQLMVRQRQEEEKTP